MDNKLLLMQAGIFLVIIGLIIIILSITINNRNNIKTEVAVGGFIGFIPFGFATNKKLLLVVLSLSVVMFILFLLSLKIKIN